jgi:hypothetical protein
MANYCVLADCVDPALTISQKDVDEANVLVDVLLAAASIKPSAVILPQPLLTTIAINAAKRNACIGGAMGDNTTLIEKANQFKKTIDMLAVGINKAALGIAEDVTGGSYASVTLGRA